MNIIESFYICLPFLPLPSPLFLRRSRGHNAEALVLPFGFPCDSNSQANVFLCSSYRARASHGMPCREFPMINLPYLSYGKSRDESPKDSSLNRPLLRNCTMIFLGASHFSRRCDKAPFWESCSNTVLFMVTQADAWTLRQI